MYSQGQFFIAIQKNFYRDKKIFSTRYIKNYIEDKKSCRVKYYPKVLNRERRLQSL